MIGCLVFPVLSTGAFLIRFRKRDPDSITLIPELRARSANGWRNIRRAKSRTIARFCIACLIPAVYTVTAREWMGIAFWAFVIADAVYAVAASVKSRKFLFYRAAICPKMTERAVKRH